jgi:hypothetical protein
LEREIKRKVIFSEKGISMQEEKSKNPDTEKQTQQIACRMGHKENSSKANWEKIIKKGALFIFLGAILIFLLILIMYAIPHWYGNSIMSIYSSNSTVAGMHITTANNLLIAVVTFFYALLTLDLVTQSKEAVIQSKEAIVQSRNTQEIMYIQTRLEKLYYPLKIMLNKHQIEKKADFTDEWRSNFRIDLHKIMPYFYLSSDKLNSCLNRFIDIFDRNGTYYRIQIKEELYERRQSNNLSEEEVKNHKFQTSVVNLHSLPSSVYEMPSDEEIEETINLYPVILKRLDTDILYYRNKLNELTATRPAD